MVEILPGGPATSISNVLVVAIVLVYYHLNQYLWFWWWWSYWFPNYHLSINGSGGGDLNCSDGLTGSLTTTSIYMVLVVVVLLVP